LAVELLIPRPQARQHPAEFALKLLQGADVGPSGQRVTGLRQARLDLRERTIEFGADALQPLAGSLTREGRIELGALGLGALRHFLQGDCPGCLRLCLGLGGRLDAGRIGRGRLRQGDRSEMLDDDGDQTREACEAHRARRPHHGPEDLAPAWIDGRLESGPPRAVQRPIIGFP